MARSFVTQLGGSSSESWVYLVNWIMAVILGLAFVFYFARLVGYVLTLILRLVVSSRYKVRVSIGAFRISPLGGRVSAKNLVISTTDYTVSVIRLNITWRYWLFKMTRVPSIFLSRKPEAEGMSPAHNSSLSTSFQVQIDGLEIFMYNRTVAYENILEKLAEPTDAKGSLRHRFSSSSLSSSSLESSPDPAPTFTDSSYVRWLLSVLPLQINVKRGALVLGNHSTPSILVASFKSALAVVDISAAASPLDLYRTNLDVTMEKFQVAMKPNITYDPNHYSEDAPKQAFKTHRKAAHAPILARCLHSLTRLLPKKLRKKEPPPAQQWHGLRRYVGDFEKDRIIELNEVEDYAKYSLLLDSVSTQMSYYYDVPGVVPRKESEIHDAAAPEFGVDLVVSMATIHYGPWAERQRGPLQTMLFPTLAQDSEPTQLSTTPGTPRSYAGFSFSLATKDEIILRIPTREFSKDKEEMTGHTDDLKQQKNTRPFGWLELKLGESTSLSSFTSYIASSSGWPNRLSAHFADLEVRSSVTHDILYTADVHTMECDVGFPLQWNRECVWNFDMTSQNGRLFFLREHLTLITDLVADFGSGPPANYENFRPFTYNVAWTIENYKLFFNVNDHNIINDTLDFDSNKYICFSGDRLDIESKIPLMGNFTACTKVDYRIFTPKLSLSLEVPPWHTVSAFMDGSNKMGSSDAFEVSGYYNYYQNIEVDHHNFAVINAVGDNVTMLFYGYFIRYLFTFRENYFGDYVKFTAFEDYVMGKWNSEDADHAVVPPAEELEDPDYWNLLKTENDLNVLFTFSVRKGLLVLPCEIFDHSSHFGLAFDNLDVDIHICPQYFDLQANASTASGYKLTAETIPSRDIVFDIPEYERLVSERSIDIIIDDLSVHTHRMLGIDDLVYSAKWDFAVSSIIVDSDPQCLSSLDCGLSNFALGFKDLENTLIYKVPIVYDAANFTFRCPEISMKIKTNVENTVLSLKIEDLLVAMNDIANHRYSSRISVSIPSIVAQILTEGGDNTYNAYLKTSLVLTNFCQKAHMLDHRRFQQAHIRRNDAPTHRAAHLLFPDTKDEMYVNSKGSIFSSVSIPSVPHPLTREYRQFHRDDESELSTEESSIYSEDFKDEANPFNPTTEYYDEDFRPANPPDPEIMNDSFVFELGVVHAFVSPTGLEAVSDIALELENYELARLMDKLHISSIKNLTHLIFSRQIADKVRLVCPSVEFKFSDQAVKSPDVVFCTSPQIPVITASLIEPSLAFLKQTLRARDGAVLVEKISTKLAAHVKELYFTFFLPGHFSSAANFVLRDVEAWLTSDENKNVVSFVEFDDAKMTLDTYLLEEALLFVRGLIPQLKAPIANFELAASRSKRWRGELAKLLTDFAKTNGVQADPRVLTKPARILRSSTDHVRFYEDWKLVTKLRSIYKQLSGSSGERQVLKIGSDSSREAYQEVMEYFESWRVWEGNMVQRERFFSDLFGEIGNTQGSSTICFRFYQFEVSVSEKGEQNTSLLLKSPTLEWKQIIPRESEQVDGEEELTRNSLVVNIEDIDISLTSESFSAVALVKKLDPLVEESSSELAAQTKVVTETEASSFGSILDFTFGLKYFRCRLGLTKTSWAMYSYDTSVSVQCMKPLDDPPSLSAALAFKEIGINFGKDELDLLNLDIKNLSAVGAGAKTNEPFKAAIDFSIGDANLKIQDPSDTLCPTMVIFLNEDINDVKAMFESDSQNEVDTVSVTKKESFSQMFAKLPLVRANFVVSNFEYHIEALNPIFVSGTVTNFEIKLGVSQDEVTSVVAYRNSLLDVKLHDLTLMRAENSGVGVRLSLAESGQLLLVDSSLSLGYLKVTTPQLSNCMDATFRNLSAIEKRVKDLQSLAPTQESSQIEEPHEEPSSGTDLMESVLFQVDVSQTYWGWSTYNSRCLYTAEFEGLRSSLLNFDENSNLRAPLHGEVNIPSTRLTVLDPSFPVGLSTLLDFNVGVKVSNNDSASEDHARSSLQVESEHLRVCLSPPVVLKLLELTNSIKHTIFKHPHLFDKKDEKEKEPEKPEIPEEAAPTTPRFSSIHVLSHNFCLGWLFNTSHKDYPGFIISAERIFAVTKSNKGKLTLMDGCLSVANGSTASSFYSQSSQVHNLNRAFMPKMQLNYFMDDNRKLWVSLRGYELDVRFMTNSVVLAERTAQSIAQIRDYLDQKAKSADFRKSKTNELRAANESSTTASPSNRPSRFTAVECDIGFAGSKTLIYKLHETDSSKTPPSLSLTSPAVRIVGGYLLDKSAVKKHVIKIEILMSESDNTVFSSCVPVIVDLVDKFKNLFKDSNDKQIETKKSEKSISSGENELGKMLKDFDVHVGVIIEKQSFSLSCEPLAKVAAIVKFDGASMIACTGVEDHESIYLFAKLDSMAASLQHIYSDERSGSIDVNSIVFSSKVGFNPELEVVSSCCVSDIRGNVKMKQYQDVDLFSDIWYPEKYRTKPVVPEKKKLAHKNSRSQMNEKVYKPSVPVTLDFIVSNTNIEIDFGAALGVMMLDVDKAWALSRQTSNWCYDFKLGIETLAVECEGRLGGFVKLKKLYLNSAIEWKIGDSEILAIPLVHMCGGLEHFYFRTIFDEHLFAFGSFQGWSISVFNRKDGVNISKDHMFVTLNYDYVELYLTSLAASDFFDIYSTISRMIEEKRTSYNEILEDSKEDTVSDETSSGTLLDIAKKLETKIEVRTGVTRVQIYPHSFHDSKTLVIQLDRSSANFTQNEYAKGVVNEIELQLNNVNASFSTTAGTSPESIRNSTVAQLIEYARKAKGGNILGFPKFMISMRTFQEYGTRNVEFLFQSSFAGTVDIRWNLGSVNCVREMYAAHKRALLSRTEMYKTTAAGSQSGIDLKQQLAEETEKLNQGSVPLPEENVEEAHKEIDKDIQDTMEKVATTSRFTYTALAPPIIEAPKLKELGNATPPLEWFGLHRNKFPDATHQLVIVTLQKLIHEIEQEYTKTMGKTAF